MQPPAVSMADLPDIKVKSSNEQAPVPLKNQTPDCLALMKKSIKSTEILTFNPKSSDAPKNP